MGDVARESDRADYDTIRRELLWEARGRTGYNDRNHDEYLPANHPLLLKLHGRVIGASRVDDLATARAPVRLVAIVAMFRGEDTAEGWASWSKIMREGWA